MIIKVNKILRRISSVFGVRCSVFIILFAVLFSYKAEAQVQQKEDLPSPRGAFLRSIVVPGWGHYYTDNDNWNRGKYHLAGEVVLVLSYFGLNARANYLENDFTTLARSKAGTNISDKSRNYIIALGDYDNLSEYNQAQLRSRNWDQLFPETPEYNWNWEARDYRTQYQDARERVDKNRSQLPSLIALMVTNRLVSGLSAFVQARNQWENVPEARFSYLNEFGEPGITASLKFDF